MLDGTPRIGRLRRDNTMVYHEAVESELGCVCHLNNSLSNASRGARRLGALPKNGTVQKRPFSGNIWPLRADPDRSRVGAGLMPVVAALGL